MPAKAACEPSGLTPVPRVVRSSRLACEQRDALPERRRLSRSALRRGIEGGRRFRRSLCRGMSALEEDRPELETEGGFGTGLRAQLDRRKRPDEPGPVPAERPAAAPTPAAAKPPEVRG